MMKSHRGVVVACVVLMAAAGALAARVEDQIAKATKLLSEKKVDEGIAILRPIVRDKTLPSEDRLALYQRILSAQTQAKLYDDAAATTDEMLAAFAKREELLTQVYGMRADLFRSAKKLDAELEALDKMVATAGDDIETIAGARLRALGYLQQHKRYQDVYTLAEKTVAELAEDPRAAQALWYMSDAAVTLQQYDRSLDAAQKLIAGYPNSELVRNHRAHSRALECFKKLNRLSDLRAASAAWEKSDPDPLFHNVAAYERATSFMQEKNSTEAIAAFRRVISAHADDGASNYWFESQTGIVDLLTAAGDTKAAIEEAHILLDVSRPASITQNVQRIADLFAKLDGNRKRADRFVLFQLYGPGGIDGKQGTADDVSNPLEEVGYPKDPSRLDAFAKAFAIVGTDAGAMKHRGLMCLYAGQPKAALYYFLDGFQRADCGEWSDLGVMAVANGLRAIQGHSLWLDGAARFMILGPAGEDQKPGTADDLADPFVVLSGFTPSASFAPAKLSDEELHRLKQLQANFLAAADDPTWGQALRTKTLTALARVIESLNEWDSMKEWYGSQLAANHEKQPMGSLASGAISASKGKVNHLGNVRAFLATMGWDNKAEKLPRDIDAAVGAYRRSLKELEMLQSKAQLMPRVKAPK